MSSQAASQHVPLYSATLVSSYRITPASSPEEVKHLTFRTDELSFSSRTGQSIRVMAPGQFGNKYHSRLYSIADPVHTANSHSEFTLCVRRCSYIDDFNGEQYKGVASNFLCDLQPGDKMEFAGPFGLAFSVPKDKSANLLMIGMGTGIAPFRAFIRHIYEKEGGWKGQVRLFYGARNGLEMLYMNDENNDLANYYDQPTFKAFQAISPRPAFAAPAALDEAIKQSAGEVWKLLGESNTHVYIAGATPMLVMVEAALADLAGPGTAWQNKKSELASSGRWNEILY
ncbi:MAG: oxidoreductase [Betaproteobacteria bacterium]|nr:oxidoreductase [Betaproteobacteria bacterium]